MPKLEQAILAALGTLPPGCWQRVDGLMTESVVLKLYPHWFPYLRLRILVWRGLIESRRLSSSYSGMSSYRLRSYRLPQ